MPAGLIIAGVGAAVSAVGVATTIASQNKERALQKQQFQYQKQIDQNTNIRQKRDAIRAARLTGGQLVQTAENQGSSGTSAAIGGQGSIQSQLDSNLSFLDTQRGLADRAGDAGNAARAAGANAGTWAQIGSLGMTIFENSDSIAKKFK